MTAGHNKIGPQLAFPQVRGRLVAVSTSAPEGIRTPNLLIRSQMLYPLSYGRLLPRRGRATSTEDTRTGAWDRIGFRPGPGGTRRGPPLTVTGRRGRTAAAGTCSRGQADAGGHRHGSHLVHS